MNNKIISLGREAYERLSTKSYLLDELMMIYDDCIKNENVDEILKQLEEIKNSQINYNGQDIKLY